MLTFSPNGAGTKVGTRLKRLSSREAVRYRAGELERTGLVHGRHTGLKVKKAQANCGGRGVRRLEFLCVFH